MYDLSIPSDLAATYRVVGTTGNISCSIGSTGPNFYVKVYGRPGTCTLQGTKDAQISAPLVLVAKWMMDKKVMNKYIVLSLLLPALAWAAPPQSSTKTWSGFYGGGHIGGVFNDASVDSAHLSFSNIEKVCNLKKNFSSLFLGGQAGVVKQLQSNLVLGVEGNYSYHFNQYGQAQCDCEFEPSDNEPPIYEAFNMVNQEQASIRGRLGYAMPFNILPYASAGVSFANLGMDYSNEGGNTHTSLSFQPGWLVGGWRR